MSAIGALYSKLEMAQFGKANKLLGYLAAIFGIGLITLALAPFQTHINSTTVALCLLLVVLIVATAAGSRPALLASVLGVLSFNYFFLPPLYTLTIADPQNWIAFAAFFITAMIAGQLSSYARRRADEAQMQKKKIEALYEELKSAFAKASEAEALRQSEKLKTALLDAVTHDLRTPLTSIKVLATALLENESEHQKLEFDLQSKKEFLETIVKETNRLNDFIEGLVELAQIEAGAFGLRLGWEEIPEIIEAALSRAERMLKGRRIKINLEENLPLVRVDSKALAEVIYTLLDNAAKYSPAESPIEISVKQSREGIVEIAVADHGPGVPKEFREKIFDKFFRIEKSESKAKGMGLGLAIAKGIIEAHGGKIWVAERAEGSGARFVFLIPIGDE